MASINENCPCGRQNKYSNCCGIIHENINLVKTAEDLMRSRYVAFTKSMGDYLMLSHHSTTRPLSEKKEIEKWAKSVEWKALNIINVIDGNEFDGDGIVEFKAYFNTISFGAKKLECIHEKSEFVKENGHWVYLSALDFD